MAKKYDNNSEFNETGNLDVCCPVCGSRNLVLKFNKKGYYWVHKCNNCGHEGREGETLGCVVGHNKAL